MADDVASGGPARFDAAPGDTPLHRLIALVPRPLRFLGVGAVGLVTDLTVFTVIPAHVQHPLLVRLISLAVATVVTWRLNRALTFDRSGRHQADEALRYAAVTAVAQGTSYGVFAALVLTVMRSYPQAAAIIGAAVAAIVSYNGHRLFAFAQHRGQGSASRSASRPASTGALRA